MNKEQLIEVLRTSLPSRRMLEVVNIGAVKVGDELIILKQRPNYDLVEEEMITYSERHDMYHSYKELIAKSVIFHESLISIRGKKAIHDYMIEEEFKYCQGCGKLLDRENNEYHARFGTCNSTCYGRMVGVYV
jgi:hypothetical protein